MKTDLLIDAIGKIDAVYVEEARQWQEEHAAGKGQLWQEEHAAGKGQLWQEAYFAEEARQWQKEHSAAEEPSGASSTAGTRAYRFFGAHWRSLAAAACLILVLTGALAALRISHLSGTANKNNAGMESTGEDTCADQEQEEMDGAAPEETDEGDSTADGADSDPGSAHGSDEEEGDPGISDGSDEEGSNPGNASETEENSKPGEDENDRGPEDHTGAEPGEISQSGLKIPAEVTFVTVTYTAGGTSERFALAGAELERLKEWAAQLTLGEAESFADGAYPGDDSGEGALYAFDFGEAYPAFSYRGNGADCFVVAGDVWYPVLNPTDPPVER